ncbi:MAG: NAD(P)/FAD-dependent oxidoreductase [Lachnospiraceae bacterium]|nr:NAD(P)/FAD-dependent oxidoreductase [Lachnospiraceae bacterium]
MSSERESVSIRLQQLHLPVTHTREELEKCVAAKLGIPVDAMREVTILKQSLDARRKREIAYVYDVAVAVAKGCRLRGKQGSDWSFYEPVLYEPKRGDGKALSKRPVIIGAGPAGLFAAYVLAGAGHRPIVIERGKAVPERIADVEKFFATGVLEPNSNVQFGVGGAGTFSDGKLNTLIKDRDGRGNYVLRTFVKFGAPEEILYRNKPHIGTDRLRAVVSGMQEAIERLGGTVMTHTTVTGFTIEDERLTAVHCTGESGDITIDTDIAVLAIGHSARDTVQWLCESGFAMEPKAFAMGVRVQHNREWVNRTQYGDAAELLPSADYKLTHTCRDGRGVYSFCMCPGGFVVNASSEPGRLAINGMSNFDRMADNSNSAIVVTVTPDDFREDYENLRARGAELREHLKKEEQMRDSGKWQCTYVPKLSEIAEPLIGMEYQRRLEELAFLAGRGAIPTQRYEDFREGRPSTGCGTISPVNKGAVHYTDLHECLPEYMADAIGEGMEAFERSMPGYGCDDALLQAIESRTSSPVRINRDETLQAVGIAGVYPCGEGAGYAGGIMSAAIDGIRVAEEIMKNN